MKKTMVLLMALILVLGVGAVTYADQIFSPAETYATLTGITAAEAYALRSEDTTFGELAKEAGVWEAFSEAMLAGKAAILEEMVEKGDLTAEEASDLLSIMENCDGTRLHEGEFSLGFRFGQGQGNGQGRHAGEHQQQGKGLRQGKGFGNKFGQ